MAAAHHPQEFFGKPFRPLLLPIGSGNTPHAVDSLVSVRRAKRVKPAIKGNSIVVEEDDDCTLRHVKSCVPRSGKAVLVMVWKYPYVI